MSRFHGAVGNAYSLDDGVRRLTVTPRFAWYRCPEGHRFRVGFHAEAVPPGVWACPRHGVEDCPLVGTEPAAVGGRKSNRVPLVMLRERRTPEHEVEVLERVLRAVRRQGGGRWGAAVVGGRGYAYPLE